MSTRRVMMWRGLSRRELAGGLVLSLLPGLALARAPIVRGRASILPTSLGEGPYQPPTTLNAVDDLLKRMTVPVRIDDQGPFPFVVDTGANQSVLSQALAAELKLPERDPGPLHGVAGVDVARRVTAQHVRIGDRNWEDTGFSVLPQVGGGAAGMLGVDLIHDQRVTLDFQQRRLRIEKSHASWGEFDLAIRGQQESGQLTIIPAEVGGRPVKAFLDSGAQSTIGNLALKRVAVPESQEAHASAVVIVSANGQTITGERAILPEVKVGKLALNRLPVTFSELHTFSMWNLVDEPALLLGIDVLSQFAAVSIDFQRSEVQFRLS